MNPWHTIPLLILLSIVGPPTGTAQDRGFGLGIILGDPTGLSGKLWTSGSNAVDFGLAWSFRKEGFIHVHADYLWHFGIPTQGRERFTFQTGIGGRLGGSRGSAVVGVRIPLVLAWWPRGVPLDVFVEVAPILDLAPATDFTVNGGIGARFFFQ
jgi:hypothetical protein